MQLGEAPDHIPATLDTRSGSAAPATSVDGGVIDRLVRHYADQGRVSRIYPAAASLGHRGRMHQNYSDQEHMCGMSRTFRIDVDRGSPVQHLVDSLNQVATIEYATPNYLSCLPFAAPAPAVATIDSDLAWDTRDSIFARDAMAYEPGDPSITIGLIDSGVAPRHPEMIRRFHSGFDTVQLGAEDFAAGVKLLGDARVVDTKPIDEFVGHGMACAGIMGAAGEMIPPGLAGTCPIIPIRVLGSAELTGRATPVGLGAISDIDMGVKIAVELGAKVLNMSFGTADSALDPTAPKPHADIVKYALLRGCVLVAASGNSGKREEFWPAAFQGVIAVGSAGLDGKPSHFSTRGDHVALCAVGERVATCNLRGYQLATGTSFAAPFVAAAAALLVSRAHRRSYPLDGDDVRKYLTRSATPWAAKDEDGCGAGILNVLAALQNLDREIDRSPPEEGEPDAPDTTDND
jgi:subtilisin family serine protease